MPHLLLREGARRRRRWWLCVLPLLLLRLMRLLPELRERAEVGPAAAAQAQPRDWRRMSTRAAGRRRPLRAACRPCCLTHPEVMRLQE